MDNQENANTTRGDTTLEDVE